MVTSGVYCTEDHTMVKYCVHAALSKIIILFPLELQHNYTTHTLYNTSTYLWMMHPTSDWSLKSCPVMFCSQYLMRPVLSTMVSTTARQIKQGLVTVLIKGLRIIVNMVKMLPRKRV